MIPDLRDILEYSPRTGTWTWRVGMGMRAKKGTVAGSKTDQGYLRIKIRGRPYLAHRLAWEYVTGTAPIEQIDHKNGDRADNRWANLRIATQSQNAANSSRQARTATPKGVQRRPNGKYAVRVGASGRLHYVGTFTCIDAAVAAYESAARKYHGDFARVSR